MEFTSGQIFLFVLRGLLTAAMPFAAYFYLKKRHDGRSIPAFAGVITVMLILIPRALFRSIFVQGAETLTGKWLTVWLIGSVFEEGGRYIAMKHAIPGYDTRADALCYGIGHGGTEVIMSAKAQFVLLADALGQRGTQEHLTALAGQGMLTAAEILLGNAANLIFHMMMSVLIARAVHYEGCKKLLPIAIFVHLVSDFTIFCFGTAADVMLTAALCMFVYLHGKQYPDGLI